VTAGTLARRQVDSVLTDCPASADPTTFAATVLDELRGRWHELDVAGTGAADVLTRETMSAMAAEDFRRLARELRRQAYSAYCEAWKASQELRGLLEAAQHELQVHDRLIGFVDSWTQRVEDGR
jgi:hypothetical protein